MVCERYEVSEKAGAAIVSATLKAFGIVTEEECVMDRSKLRRERRKYIEKTRNKKRKLFELVDFIFVD